jgi:Arc/MetJ-type ribon-helix-helix transcriptional regulator
MNMQLKKSQQDWLDAQVASGRFATIDEALDAAVARLQADEITVDAWAQPFIDLAIKALDQGEGTPWHKGEALKKIKAGRAGGR